MNETEEVWKDVVGYEGLYQVSNIGNVKRIEHEDFNCRQGHRIFKERMKSQRINFRGYPMVRLSKNNRSKEYFVHRLVAGAFIPNPHNYPQVNHKDEDKKNNRVENLEWCTNKYNNNYGSIRNKRSIAMTNYHKKKTGVHRMTREEKIKGLYSLKEYLVENPVELEGHKSLPITLIDYAIDALEQQPCDVFDEYGNYKYPSEVELTEPNTATSMPCEDAISREDALMALTGEWTEITDEIIHRFIKRIKALPPVNPQPCEDAISREATLKPYNGLNDEDTISVWLIRKNIEQQPPVTPQPKAEQFAKWVAGEIFDDMWEYNKDAFTEIACRKLAKLGIVIRMGDEWELIDPQESEG